MTVTSVICILWRLFFTLPLHAGIVSLIAGIALFSAEFISMLEAVIHYICMSKDHAPEFPVIEEADYPHVDVMIDRRWRSWRRTWASDISVYPITSWRRRAT